MSRATIGAGRPAGPKKPNQEPASKTGQAFQAQITKLGFKLNFRQVQHAEVISKFCGTPKANVAICPTLGWGKDFFDSQSMLDPILNGKNIIPAGNANYAQADDPKLNAAMDKAETIVRVNGRVADHFRTNNMIDGVAKFISRMSQYLTLYPGDIVWMGTEGSPQNLKHGDVCEIEITGIGTLRNPLVREGM